MNSCNFVPKEKHDLVMHDIHPKLWTQNQITSFLHDIHPKLWTQNQITSFLHDIKMSVQETYNTSKPMIGSKLVLHPETLKVVKGYIENVLEGFGTYYDWELDSTNFVNYKDWYLV